MSPGSRSQPILPTVWKQALEGAYGVIHLAGAPVFGRRWNRAYKDEIYRSRVLSTWSLATAMAEMKHASSRFHQ